MAKGVIINEIAKLIDEEPFEIVWENFNFTGGWGNRLAKYKKKGAARGIYNTGIGSNISIPKVYKKLKNNDFSDIAGFYVGILCFFSEKVWKKLKFVEKIPKNSINKVVSGLVCPIRYEEEMYEICHSEYNFIDFITAAHALEKTNFDKETAISVYKLQGDKAIFPLLCQIFYTNKGIEQLRPSLSNNAPVQLEIQVSKWVSGCHFPVMVSPSVSEFKWKINQNGHFLYGKYQDEWHVLDVAGVGNLCLGNYPLANRMNYFGSGGKTIPYAICWNWGDIIEAYHYFSTDLLIRDLKNDIFTHYWFILGLSSLLNVRFRDGHFGLEDDCRVVPSFDGSLISLEKRGVAYVTADLSGDFVDFCDKDDVFYSDREAYDWFEIGSMLK